MIWWSGNGCYFCFFDLLLSYPEKVFSFVFLFFAVWPPPADTQCTIFDKISLNIPKNKNIRIINWQLRIISSYGSIFLKKTIEFICSIKKTLQNLGYISFIYLQKKLEYWDIFSWDLDTVFGIACFDFVIIYLFWISITKF